MRKPTLLAQLEQAGVQLNALGRELFADPRFITSATCCALAATQLTVSELGFAAGATFAEVMAAAASRGLSPCELELAPHFRLQFMDQPEGAVGQPASQNQAPPGSITVASLPISEDESDPQGFYLRRINGVLWLRGYRSWAGHIWNADDEFIFVGNAA